VKGLLCLLVLIAAFHVTACDADSAGSAGGPDAGSDTPAPLDTAAFDFSGPDLVAADAAPDLAPLADTADVFGPSCEAGEGCFLDPCVENGDCQSGWCVDHLGDGVCTTTCSEECPAGWSCQQVAGTDPDVVFICVSHLANLCRPCADALGCLSTGGVEDVCLDYGAEGSFCGAPCDPEDVKSTCPWGFSCQEALTVDGIPTAQCVADAGVCPCTAKAVALSLWTPCGVENAWGLCQGKRVCTADGLTACDAAAPAPELCNGLDDDCDGETDEPDLVDGAYLGLCDDGNACTDDGCAGADGCTHAALEQGECVDGDACTVGDHCEAGVCLGSPVACDDGNPCTDDLCDGLGGCEFLVNDASCDDGDPCTVADQCGDGACAGVPVSCDCQSDGDCAALEDGDLCNGTLVCDTAALPFQCTVDPDTVVTCAGPPPGPDQICLVAVCDPQEGACALAPANEGLLCDDGDPCTVGEACAAGACAGGVAPNCNDGNLCTDDACDPLSGCTHAPNAAPCSDGDVCTVVDQCAGGQCVGAGALSCDDGDPCTDDLCDPATGCQHLPAEGAACDDGNACTVGDHCAAGACVFDGPAVCTDGNPCTTDSCAPATGCVFTLNEVPCDDGDLCTTGDHCHLGLCVAAGALACDDGNLCTDDACAPGAGCTHTPNAAPCDDGNACTAGDHCAAGSCVAAAAVPCDDGDLCTDDTCDPAAGCVFTMNEAPCDDGDLCTTGDHCHLGDCVAAGALGCDDGNVCTDDACLTETGCSFTPNGAPCDDGDPCTTGDHCAGGWCLSTTLDCDDDNVCTDDACGPAGCVNTPNSMPCPGGICVGGACACVPFCDGQDCGDDGCGGSCGTCAGQDLCVDGACLCQPDCLGLECGDDGCGGSCGTCAGGATCTGGVCVGVVGKRVFVTSTLTTAGLGGLAGADSFCQQRANAANLGGTFRAWLSLSGSSASQRLVHSATGYKLVDGTVVASSWADLTDGTLQHSIGKDESGNNVASGYVWTATKADGSFNSESWGGCGGAICGGFTIGGSCMGGSAGFGGESGKTDAQWTDTVCGCCTNLWRLYCFEQ
jgi:hypothetical protein